jgi:hypothetical protein
MANQDPGTHMADLAGLTAENLIKKLGSFPPFGMGLDRDQKSVVYSKSKDGKALLTLESVPELIREDTGAGRLIATAVIAIVQAAPSASESPRDVIAIQIQVPGNDPAVLGRTFKKGFFGGYKFGEPFVINQPIAAKVFG